MEGWRQPHEGSESKSGCGGRWEGCAEQTVGSWEARCAAGLPCPELLCRMPCGEEETPVLESEQEQQGPLQIWAGRVTDVCGVSDKKGILHISLVVVGALEWEKLGPQERSIHKFQNK